MKVEISESQWKLCIQGAIGFYECSLKYIINMVAFGNMLSGLIFLNAKMLGGLVLNTFFSEKYSDVLKFDECLI